MIPNGAISTGCKVLQQCDHNFFTIPAGQTTLALPPVVQGNVAGNIHVAITTLTANGVSVLPTPAPAAPDLVIPRSVPVITDMHLENRTASGFTLVIQGYSTPRDMVKATLSFTPAQDAAIDGATSFDVNSVSTVLTNYYADPGHLVGGSSFDQLKIPVTIDGDMWRPLPA